MRRSWFIAALLATSLVTACATTEKEAPVASDLPALSTDEPTSSLATSTDASTQTVGDTAAPSESGPSSTAPSTKPPRSTTSTTAAPNAATSFAGTGPYLVGVTT